MTVLGIMLMLLLSGCASWTSYQQLQQNLSAVSQDRDELSKEVIHLRAKLDRCNELKAGSKNTTIMINQGQKAIEPEKLEEIKRQALDDAERKYQMRIRRIKRE